MANQFNLVAAIQLQTVGLGNVRNEIEKTLKSVKVDLDLTPARKALADLQAKVQSIKLNVTLDTRQATAQAALLNKQLSGFGPVSADINKLSSSMTTLASSLGVVTANAQAALAALKQLGAAGQSAAATPPSAPGPAPNPGGRGRSRSPQTAIPSTPDDLLEFAGRVRLASALRTYSDRIFPAQDVNRAALSSGTAGSYVVQQGLAGTVRGAAEGATIAGLPGLVAGATIGLVASLRDAAREIEQVRIGRVLEKASESFERAGQSLSGRGFGSDTDLEQAATRLDLAARKQIQLYDDERGSFLKGIPEAFGSYSGRTADIVAGARVAADKAGSGAASSLAIQAQRLGTNDPTASSAQLLAKLGSDPLNAKVLQVLAVAKSEGSRSLEEFTKRVQSERQTLLNNLAKDVEAGQRQGLAQQVAAQNDAATNSLRLLTLAATRTADSLGSLHTISDQLGTAFSGQVGAGRVSGLASAGTIAAALPGEAGRQFGLEAYNLSRASALLPTALAQIAARRPESEQEFVSGLSEKLAALPDDLRDAIISGIQEKLFVPGGLADTTRRAGLDSEGFARSLLAGRREPFEQAQRTLSAQITGQANTFLGGLARYQGQQQIMGAEQDRLSAIRLSGLSAAAQFKAEDLGRRRDADDLLSLADLQRPFTDRQERLTGFRGAAALDANAIGKQLQQVQYQLEGAALEQQRQFARFGGGGVGFQRASDELATLTRRASDLQGALRNLTDETRTAAARQKLSDLDRNRDSRLSFGERFLSGDFTERNRINRGLLLSSVANKQGNLDGLAQPDQRLVIETLRSLGSAKLPGLGGQNAGDVLEKLIRNSLGGAFDETGDQKNERQELRQAILDGEKGRAEAQRELIAAQGRLSQEFFTSLHQSHDAFFGRLAETLAGKGAIGKAGGGSIFQARGTDTVPAMLTPGEFVVNAAAAKRHAGLLQKINAGTAYLAGGGFPLFPRGPDPYAVHPLEQGLRAFKEFKDRQREQMPVPDHERVRQAIAEAKQRIGDTSQTYGEPSGPDAPDMFAQTIGTPQGPDAPAPGGGGGRVMVIPPRPRPQAQRGVAAPLSAEETVIRDFRRETLTNPLGVSGYVASGYSPLFRQQQYVANLARRQRYAQTGDTIGMRDAVVSLDKTREKQLENRRLAQAFGTARIKAGLSPVLDIGPDLAQVVPGSLLKDALRPTSPFVNDQQIFRRLGGGGLGQRPWRRFATGGLVPGAGTSDTVPSLLTPGEFVLNRGATQALGLGSVPGQGGAPGAGLDFSGFQAGATAFGNHVATFTQSLTAFNGNATALSDAINKMPRTLSIQQAPIQVTVQFNGAEAFKGMSDEFEKMATSKAKDAIRSAFKNYLPDDPYFD